jgi:ribosome-associated translation inhibitor RaiA
MRDLSPAFTAPEIQVEAQGGIPPGTAEKAREKVGALLRRVRQPVLFARIRLTHAHNPATARPFMIQVNIDVDGRPTRAHVAAERADEAVDLVCDRLDRQLARLRDRWTARHGGTPRAGAHEWRHGAEPAHRPDFFPRPVEGREVIRHKSFALACETPDEAAFEMDLMDYDFHLFTDLGTGEDSVVYRPDRMGAGGSRYRMARVRSRSAPSEPSAVSMTVSPVAAPHLDVHAAQRRLEASGQPFVFFMESGTGRGNVLYHRYDGHYGLITPAG